ncbi:hypothetical protein CRE_02740 [Caenorhabditis remanei]|uniref:Uncharacterized protein n=1 Tax=Caenorhabditis remanei TaxID=31234 RepID=E3NQQ2_CAERE|nr:hypothetical protein CRE_02740 [Caenorhabditis remanei]
MQYFDDIIPFGEFECREALEREVKRHRYWKTKAVKKMNFDRIETSTSIQYILESFTEARSTSEANEAANFAAMSEASCSMSGGGALSPWDFEVMPNQLFVDQVRVFEMPGSSQINPCSACNSEGTIHCFHCRGYGTDKCSFCSKNEKSEHYTECEIPEKLLLQAEGKRIFEEEQDYIIPISKYPQEDVNNMSKLFCAQHLQKCMGVCRVIRQRHYMNAIPISKVHFSLGNEKGIFYVYGTQKLCFFPNFPSKCVIL